MRFRIIELFLFVFATALTITCLIRPDELHETIYFSFTLIAILFSIVMAIGRAKSQRSFWIAFSVISIGYLAFAHLPDSDENCPRQYGPEYTTQFLAWTFYEEVDDPFFDPFDVFSTHQENPLEDDDPFDGEDVKEGDDPFANDPFEPDNSVAGDPFGEGEAARNDPNDADDLLDLIESIINQDEWVDTGGGLGLLQPYPANIVCLVSPDESVSFFRIGHSAWALLFGWIAAHLAQFIYRKTHAIQ